MTAGQVTIEKWADNYTCKLEGINLNSAQVKLRIKNNGRRRTD